VLRERWPLWKADLYNLELISLWGCNFWVGGLAYDNISFNFLINLATNCKPLSEITLSDNLCNFHTLSLNNLANPSSIIFSVIAIKLPVSRDYNSILAVYDRFLKMLYFIINSTDIYCYDLSSTVFGLNFPAGISALFFILWHWLHFSVYCFTSFVTPGYQ